MPVHIQYPRNTLARTVDGSVGVVAGHHNGEVVVYTLANRRRHFARREIASDVLTVTPAQGHAARIL
jgi:hypothetical protein